MNRIELLENALEHIMKVAGQAHRPTRRLDWISDRARLALAGEEYSENKMPQYPKNNSKQRHAPENPLPSKAERPD